MSVADVVVIVGVALIIASILIAVAQHREAQRERNRAAWRRWAAHVDRMDERRRARRTED